MPHFNNSKGRSLEEKILDRLMEAHPGALTRTQLNPLGSSQDVGEALSKLHKLNLAIYTRGRTGKRGRPVEMWRAIVVDINRNP